MIHPLVNDISTLKDAEIEGKIQDLQRKYFQTQNTSIKQQMVVFLDLYRNEMQSRRAKALEQQYQKRDRDLDGLINAQ